VWSRLRVEYYARLQQDTPYQLNQWFSSPDWFAVNSDSAELGDDLAYSHIETAFGSGMVGDIASIASAREIDRACSNGD
jgi:hypothetical protein